MARAFINCLTYTAMAPKLDGVAAQSYMGPITPCIPGIGRTTIAPLPAEAVRWTFCSCCWQRGASS